MLKHFKQMTEIDEQQIDERVAVAPRTCVAELVAVNPTVQIC